MIIKIINQKKKWHLSVSSKIEQDILSNTPELRELFNPSKLAYPPIILYYKSSRNSVSSQRNKPEVEHCPFPSNPNFPLKPNLFPKSSFDIWLSQVYQNNLMPSLFIYEDFAHWFKAQEDYENEQKVRNDKNYINRSLMFVRQALEMFLRGLSGTHFSGLRVVRSQSIEEIGFTEPVIAHSLVITKNGIDLKVEQLSDGERMCLVMVGDIARRLVIANRDFEGNPLEGKGVILIDEIESHLHPQWQREIIPSLQKTFPNCQFIVTTHSPQVLSKVKKENIRILEDGTVCPADSFTYGRDSNSILSELMNVTERPFEIKEELNQCFNLIDEMNLDEAKSKLKELAQRLGEKDSEIVRAYTLMDFLERIQD
ncbi:AAA family ATPase [Spirulina subsalsa FACHB-351]|uniref:AAA family ATPase n=1 Tax=Spirulina subsalsa FACHB-351 TaxID=234711 RepID=A0ABT3L659_9CYAN|nr:AAA family ATPase [Spirulina subsalsa]MCW6036672.1 AAA family ATPase [Spirulina subsalsa FACHB-351]